MRKDSSLSCMTGFINAAVGIECILSRGKYRIELRLLDVGLVAIDSFQCRVRIDREAIGTISEYRT